MILLAFVIFMLLASPAWAADAAEVGVQLKEFSVQATPQTLKAGEVRFVAVNKGLEKHELVVRKKEKDNFKELGEIEPFAAGMTKQMTLHLSPGTYELSCLVVEKEEGETVDHYKKGMRIEIQVK